MNKPQTIQIFLPDGSPTSLKEAELTNRLIKTLYFPRSAIEKAAKRKIVRYTGVYFLFGTDDDGKPIVYIGEGENCWERIKDHHRKKDFWTDCIIAITKTDEYTKTDAKFLEHYCLKKANEVGRFITENSKDSSLTPISEPREADLKDNFETIKTLTGALGYPLFEDKKAGAKSSKDKFFCRGKDAEATAYLTNEGILVMKGSNANMEETPTAGSLIINMRNDLKEQGVLVRNDNVLVFQEDFLFKSPSAAAGTILGRRANGWMEWKDNEGKTLDEVKRK